MNTSTFQKTKYQLNIKILSENNEIIKYYESFNSHYFGDSGIDLYSLNDNIIVESLKIGSIDYEIKCEMIDLDSNEYTSYYLVPRSSLSKTNFQMANSIGIIDAGYRGNIITKVRNFNDKNETFPIGSYFQIVAPDLKPIRVCIVDELSNTNRDNNGFGSSGNIILNSRT
jgi:dUTP pyrophosphatase